MALVHAQDPERGRLADDGGRRERRDRARLVQQAPGAQGAGLLVVGEEQHELVPESRDVGRGEPVDREGEEALHVGRAAGDVGSIAPGQGERVGLPALRFGRHGVHVAGEDQTAVAVFRAGRHDQVELGAVGRRVPGDAHAGAVEVVADEVGDLPVALVAGGVEGDEAGEKGLVGERLGGHRSPEKGSTMAVRR